MQENENVSGKRKNIKTLLFIIIAIIILLLISCIIIIRIGKIGYETSGTVTEKILEISQKDVTWNKIEDLNIFDNPQFNNEKIVVPMSKGSYEFIIKNNMNERIQYSIYLSEINKHNVNMKYRLKLNNVYVLGDENTWLDIHETKLENIIVPENSSNIYTLEWYWEEDTNDTQIGKLVYAEYKCKINVISELYTQTKDV